MPVIGMGVFLAEDAERRMITEEAVFFAELRDKPRCC